MGKAKEEGSFEPLEVLASQDTTSEVEVETNSKLPIYRQRKFIVRAFIGSIVIITTAILIAVLLPKGEGYKLDSNTEIVNATAYSPGIVRRKVSMRNSDNGSSSECRSLRTLS